MLNNFLRKWTNRTPYVFNMFRLAYMESMGEIFGVEDPSSVKEPSWQLLIVLMVPPKHIESVLCWEEQLQHNKERKMSTPSSSTQDTNFQAMILQF